MSYFMVTEALSLRVILGQLGMEKIQMDESGGICDRFTVILIFDLKNIQNASII